jgi:cbb3-type cytochrome oxidase maturation protein
LDILFLLVPMSALLVFLIIGVFAWALYRGQFDNLEHEGERILHAESTGLDADQHGRGVARQQLRVPAHDPAKAPDGY